MKEKTKNTKYMGVWVEPAMYKQLQYAALKEDKCVGQYVRKYLAEAIKYSEQRLTVSRVPLKQKVLTSDELLANMGKHAEIVE